MVRDLTADDRAFLARGGRINCEMVNGHWVKVRVPPGGSTAPVQRATEPPTFLVRAGVIIAGWELDELKRKVAR